MRIPNLRALIDAVFLDNGRAMPGKLQAVISEHVLEPVRAMRLRYLPLLMVYFAYGALGIIDISRDLWVKESLTLTPAEIAGIGVWLGLPWTVKMVFGELVDTVAIFGSRRRIYVFIGAALVAAGLLVLAGAAGRHITALPINHLFVIGMMLVVIGTVLQDVVADAMSTEVVPRTDENGAPRKEEDIVAELGMVQVLGRLALSIGILSVAGLSGILAKYLARETVFLLALAVPAISVVGVILAKLEPAKLRPLNWKFLGGGIAFGAVIVALGVSNLWFAQELTFLISMAVICGMLVWVTRSLDPAQRSVILFTAIVIFFFRATPSVGDGYFWWSLDVLKFDETFYGVLRQTSAIIGLAAMWVFAKELTQYSVQKVLYFLIIVGLFLSLPTISLYYGLHHWTEQHFGIGARSIALIDAAASSPFAQLSMIPLLTLIARYAPGEYRATWFALMASLMNLALVMGQLQTKYLNTVFPVQRGDYTALGQLMIVASLIAFVVPLIVLVVFGRRIR
jgi:MFS family permease